MNTDEEGACYGVDANRRQQICNSNCWPSTPPPLSTHASSLGSLEVQTVWMMIDNVRKKVEKDQVERWGFIALRHTSAHFAKSEDSVFAVICLSCCNNLYFVLYWIKENKPIENESTRTWHYFQTSLSCGIRQIRQWHRLENSFKAEKENVFVLNLEQLQTKNRKLTIYPPKREKCYRKLLITIGDNIWDRKTWNYPNVLTIVITGISTKEYMFELYGKVAACYGIPTAVSGILHIFMMDARSIAWSSSFACWNLSPFFLSEWVKLNQVCRSSCLHKLYWSIHLYFIGLKLGLWDCHFKTWPLLALDHFVNNLAVCIGSLLMLFQYFNIILFLSLCLLFYNASVPIK